MESAHAVRLKTAVSTKAAMRFVCFAVLAAGVALIFLLNLGVGAAKIDLSEIARILFGAPLEGDKNYLIIRRIRLPRALASLAGGASLAISGLLLQTYFANPIIEPYILGVTSGSTLFVGRLTPEDHRIVDEALKTVGALDLGERNFTSLSDGEKQKVLIARALAQEPELIILDEPTSHLDIKHKVEVIRILSRLSLERGMTVIMALHDIDIAAKNCQTLLLVKDGRAFAQGRPEDIIGENTIGELYDIEGAAFDALTGSLEVCNDRAPEVFVAAGAGTGPAVYRVLSRLGYGIATGILQENDIDCRVASSMRLHIIGEKPFEPISSGATERARQKMGEAKFIVDCGFPLGQFNRENAALLGEAVVRGFPVISFRGSSETAELWGEAANLFSVSSAAELCDRIADLGYTPSSSISLETKKEI